MKIAVIGTGYVGLVTGVVLASKGHILYCIDKDIEKIEKLKNKKMPIYESGLEELFTENNERIYPGNNLTEAVQQSDVIFIAVGTPFNGSKIDLSYIKTAAAEIGQAISKTSEFKVVVVKSTVIPNTTLGIVKEIILKESDKTINDIGFCMNPEFLREGKAVFDSMNPDRIVLGVSDHKTESIMKELYADFKDTDFVITNPTTAEMIKYTANSFFALCISYSNEIARICEKLENVDSTEVFEGVFLDKRISPIINNKRIFPDLTSYLKAGCGFGGSCFPKDVKAISSFEKDYKVDGKLLEALLYINESQLKHIFQLGLTKFNSSPKTITVLGTAFKPETDDIRESPGIKIIEEALKNKFKVKVHDYFALNNTMEYFNNKISYYGSPFEAIRKTDIVYITTVADGYKEISDEKFEELLDNNSIVVDCRSIYSNRPHKNWRVRVGFNN